MSPAPPIRVNRAPVLTLWAAVAAERLGHPPDTALSLASAVAGTAAHAKARRLEDGASMAEDVRQIANPKPTVTLLGRTVAVVHGPDGVLHAAGSDGKPAPAEPVRSYLARAFGNRLAEARQAMHALAESLPPDELNRVGFCLYERFRPEVPEPMKGWGAKGELHLERIRWAGE
jgi:hypothetical protein